MNDTNNTTSIAYHPNYYPPTPSELARVEDEKLTPERLNNMVKIVREKREAEQAYNRFIQSITTSSASE